MKTVRAPLTKEEALKLNAGDQILLSGIIYAARDAAHKKFIELLDKGHSLPFEPFNQVIYYVGPCPEKPGAVIGSAGPTTSGRMDAYTPRLLDLGITGMIGKGLRSKEVIDSIKKNGSVYFGAVGGAGAIISKSVISQEIIAFEELGAETLRRLTVVDMPLTVLIDSKGENLYDIGKLRYCIK